MRSKFILIQACVLLLISSTSCYNCVECSECNSPEDNVSEVCYSEAKEYYRNRQEWRQDVKSYEKVYGCKCK